MRQSRQRSRPYGAGWLIKIDPSDIAELDGLMDAEAYRKFWRLKHKHEQIGHYLGDFVVSRQRRRLGAEGHTVAAAQEERFTRKTRLPMPVNAIAYCLQEANLSRSSWIMWCSMKSRCKVRPAAGDVDRLCARISAVLMERSAQRKTVSCVKLTRRGRRSGQIYLYRTPRITRGQCVFPALLATIYCDTRRRGRMDNRQHRHRPRQHIN